jgi:hypothetical protein
MSRLVLFYTKQGKFVSGRCSAHLDEKARVRPRGNELEVYCPHCQSGLMLVANKTELDRLWNRAKNVMSPSPKRRR